MKCKDITNEMQLEIIEATKNSLLKLCIPNIDIMLEIKEDRLGKEYIKLLSSAFNSIPVIYKSIYINGRGNLTPVPDHEGVYDLKINIEYWFKYFNGGENGVDIGTLHFRVFERDGEYTRVAFIGLII